MDPTVALLGMIGTTIAGGIIQGTTAAQTNKIKTQAYRNAAKDMADATRKYSGANLDSQMTNAGVENARNQGMIRSQGEASKVGSGNANAAASAYSGQQNIDSSFDTTGDYGTGASNAYKNASGKYGAQANKTGLALKQADIDYNVANQAVAGGLQTLGQGINTIKTVSDENEKNFTRADIQDSLRQIKSILYEYKNPEKEGEDDEIHVGTTAQMMEETPLEKDAVEQGEDGIRRVDGWKLLESINAGMAEIQKEIDEINNNSNKNKEETEDGK